MKKSIAVLAAASVLILALVGCSPVSQAEAPAPEASIAQPPVTEEPKPTPPPKLDLLAFGEAMTWDDGMSLSVSAVEPYQAGEWAAGVVEGQPQVQFRIVVTNGTQAVYEPTVYGQMISGGQGASQIFDSGNGLVGAPMGAVLPGQTIEWIEAYSVADPASLTFQVSPGYEYEDAIFTNVAP
jgi:hypothetical protein